MTFAKSKNGPFKGPMFIFLAVFLASSLAMSPQMMKELTHRGEQLARERFAAMKSLPWRPISASCNASLGWLANGNNTKLLTYYADAFGKPAGGIQAGALLWIGSYGECTSIPGAHYCLANIGTKYIPATIFTPGIKWGLCVPKGCSETDIANGIYDILLALNITSKVYPVPDAATAVNGDMKSVHCDAPSEYTGPVIATLTLFGFLAFLCFVGTLIEMSMDFTDIFDDNPKGNAINMSRGNGVATNEADPTGGDTRVNSDKEQILGSDSGVSTSNGHAPPSVAYQKSKKNIIVEVFLCFSLIRNTSRILDTNIPPGAITSINGMRVLSMFWVILGHSFMMDFALDVNLLTSYQITQRFTFQAILNATVSVDSFFFLSGLLVAYLSLRHMEKNNGKLNLFQFYFHRFWRLTPAYMLVLLFYDKLTGFLGEGPMWYQQQINPNCDKYWWSNLLYINNFYPTNFGKQCMGWSWYLANDMQFYIISPVILYLTYRFGKRGLMLTVGFLLGASFLTTGLIINHYGYNTGSLTGETTVKGAPDYMTAVYGKPYCRIAPYLVGMVLGYVFHSIRSLRSPSKGFLVFGWCMALVCTLAPLYGTYSTVRKDNPKPFNHVEKVMYGTFMRFSWSLGLAWVVYVCHIGKGGIVNKILSASFWIPLSRLTYMAYLIHLIVLSVYFGSFQTVYFFSDKNTGWNFIAAATTSYLLAYIVSVTMEIPMMQLEKIIFKTDRKKD